MQLAMNLPTIPKPRVSLESPLADTLRRLDKLNRFARSKEPNAHLTREWIYRLKEEALERAQRAGLAAHRGVRVESECRPCKGTGRYTDSGGYAWPHCRACQSTGRVTLRFVETTLLGGELRWHTPWDKAWRFRHGCEWGACAPTDWRPQQPGEPVPLPELLTLLCDVEEVLKVREAWKSWNDRYGDSGEYDLAQYRIDVGASYPGRCDACQRLGRPMATHGYGVTSGRIEWHAHACAECAEQCPGVTLWQRFTMPEALVSDPAVRRWIATHPKAEESLRFT